MKHFKWFFGSLLLIITLVVIFIYLDVSIQTRLTLYLLISFLLAMFRILKGPTPADRAVATDIVGILVIGFCGILAVHTGKAWYLDIAIAWALQSFIGILALAKFLEGRNFDD
jgi:multicomponent Na+:H+ antiporter subunit F